ncbi:CinsV2_orph1 protein [Chelonus insularis]|nr:CinsV2_orph1 protein [Chelonus insularis]
MSHQLRSSQLESKLKGSSFESAANFSDGNKSVKNGKLNSKLSLTWIRKKLKKQRESKLNSTDCSDTEALDTDDENFTAFLEAQIHKKAKQFKFQKHHFIDQPKCVDKNVSTRISKRHRTILDIPKKRFRNVETVTAILSENNQSDDFYKQSKLDLPKKFDHANLTQDTEALRQDNYSNLLTRKRRRIRSNSSSNYTSVDENTEIERNNISTTCSHSASVHNEETKDLTNTPVMFNNSSEQPTVLLFDEKLNTTQKNIQPDQSNSTDMAQKTILPVPDSSASNLIPDPSNNIHVINDTIEPLSSCTENSVMNNNSECIILTEQNSAPTYYTNNQPLFPNSFETGNTNTQNYLPINTFYAYVTPPNPIIELSQKIDRIQEMLITVNETLKLVVESQKKLEDTQDDIKIELNNLKIQTLAYENRENWLAENGIILPMKTKEEFEKFCALLEQSSECRQIFEISIHFAINSKRSLTRNIASVIRKYFIPKLANHFTAVRYVKDKDVLANTSFYKHLLKNFLEKSADGLIFPGLTEMEFNKALGEVLCNAKDSKKRNK